MCKHIVVLLPNIPGQFYKTASILKSKDINILGFSLSSEGRSGILYLLCEQHELAFKLLRDEYSYYCSEKEVVIVEGENQVGTLEPILKILADNDINLPNSYQSPSTRGTVYIVLEFSKIEEFENAKALLIEEKFKVLSQSQI